MLRDRDYKVLSVAVIDDQPEIRKGLSVLINGTPGFECQIACGSMEEALVQLSAASADIALMDLGLPGLSGIEGTRILRQKHPRIQVIVLTVYDDDTRIFSALCAGAVGYMLKNTPPARLLECISDVAAGGSAVSPEIARRVIALFQRTSLPEQSSERLTPYEMKVLNLLMEGHNYKTAALELHLSVNTVSFHVRRIYEKLQVHSKSEAVAKVLRERPFFPRS